jgi:Shikimate kinase
VLFALALAFCFSPFTSAWFFTLRHASTCFNKHMADDGKIWEVKVELETELLETTAAEVGVMEKEEPRRILPIDRPVSWLALAGFMGTGKSRIGWELSRRLSLTFIDTDKVIERVSCMRISDIFEYYGEATFRDYESEVVRRTLRLDEVVISTGGGTVMRPQNREMLKSRGPVIVLWASPETIYMN